MKSGIYKIECIPTGKFYVGSSINLKSRKRKHFDDLSNGIHHSRYLQNAYNKYGKHQFSFTVIEQCEPEKLIEREQQFIDELKPDFNICKVAGSSLGVKRSNATKKKHSERMKKMWSKSPSRQKGDDVNWDMIDPYTGDIKS